MELLSIRNHRCQLSEFVRIKLFLIQRHLGIGRHFHHYTNLLKRYKIEDTDNLLSSAVNNDKIIFFWSKDSGSMNRIITIFKEHYQKTVYFEEVEKVTSDMSIYKLKAD